ncbi:hypothetical protein AGMMS49992_27090 [Clostridia bacterium]|nr:hypothetical protein AGMMS49992_27090 [Clostridia bacterium]
MIPIHPLTELRKREKLTQKELGEIIGVSQRAIANYENGLCNPSPKTSEAIRELFSLTVDEMWRVCYKAAS